MLEEFLWQAFITLLVVADPIAIVPVYLGLTAGESDEYKKQVTRKSCLIAVLLLVVFAIAGDKLLDVIGISEPAFRITGGFLLLLTGIDMVVSKNSHIRTPTGDEAQEAILRLDISVFPLAIPLMAGPGAMTSIVILMRQAEEISLIAQIGCMMIMIFVISLTFISMRYGGKIIMKYLGLTGTNVLTRVFGVILSALAFQNIITGIVSVVQSTKI